MEQYLRVGVITNSHGIKGEVKVFPTTDDIKRFDYLEEAVIDTGKDYINVNVTGVKYFKNMVILKFKQYDNINDILKFEGREVLFPVIEQCILNKDIENKTITVHVMKGLMD